MAAIGLAFVVIAVVVQLSTLVFARTQAETVTAQAARRAAVPGLALDEIERNLELLLVATVPGASAVEATVRRTPDGAEATATVVWVPPGPDFLRLDFTVTASTGSVDAP